MGIKKKAIIVDIDGTLAKHNRSPFNYELLDTDSPHEDVIRLVNILFDLGYHVIIVSGRPDKNDYRARTRAWLVKHGVKFHELHMRKGIDTRKDDIVKYEIYVYDLEPKYDVEYVFDDRDRVVSMWRDTLHLRCLQVAPGDF